MRWVSLRVAFRGPRYTFAVIFDPLATIQSPPLLTPRRTPSTTYANPPRDFASTLPLMTDPSALVGALMSFNRTPEWMITARGPREGEEAYG